MTANIDFIRGIALAAFAVGTAVPASADWHYKPYEYEAWMLQRMRVENARGILNFGYPGPHLTLSAEPEAFYAEGDVDGYETVRGAPGVPPHRVLRAERPIPVEAKDGYFDLGHEDIGYVRVRCAKCPNLFVGESLAEMRNSDTNGFEQSTRMVRESCDGWRSDIPLALRYFRFDGPVSDVAFCAQSDPAVPQGSFASGDARTDRAWAVGAETLRLCTRTFFLDAVKRDRLPWAGDLVVTLFAQAYVFADPEPARRSLAVLGAVDPKRGHVNGIGPFSLWWVIGHDVFQRYFGDAAFLKIHYPRIRARMEELVAHEDASGFLAHNLGWNFMDWTDSDSHTLRSAITLQGIYFGALQAAVRLARRQGDAESADRWARRAERLRQAVLAKGMDGTRHARIMAIVYDLVEGDELRRLAKEIAADGLPPTITPYMSSFEVMALVKGGETAAARRKYESVWGAMVDAGVGTFWESWNPSDKGDQAYCYYGRPFGKSLCHAWSSGPAFLFPMVFMGVRPTEDGWRKFKVAPGFAGFAPNARIRVMTPPGPVEVRFDKGTPCVLKGRDRLQ